MALRHANAKFERRFTAVEQRFAPRGITNADAAELDAAWEAIKAEIASEKAAGKG